MGSPDSHPIPGVETTSIALHDLQPKPKDPPSNPSEDDFTTDPQNLSPKSTIPLPNSPYTIPLIGITIPRSHGPTVTSIITNALHSGHRLLDTSQLYNNEIQINRAVFNSYGASRSSVFLSTKILFPRKDADATFAAIQQSVSSLAFGDHDDDESSEDDGNGTAKQPHKPKESAKKKPYIDLFSIASPHGGPSSIKTLYTALEHAHSTGLIRNIGVCNFSRTDLESLKTHAKIWPPAINQLELHPWCQQRETVAYCRANGIAVATYCPLVRGQKVWDETLMGLAEKYRRDVAGVLVRYAVQKGWVVLLREDGRGVGLRGGVGGFGGRVEEVFGWGIEEGDMSVLDGLDRGALGAVVRGVPGGSGENGDIGDVGGIEEAE